MDAQPPATPAGPSTGENLPSTLQLFATGLNAHGQISASQSGTDLHSVTVLTTPTPDQPLRLLYAGWSTTVLQIGTQVLGLGLQDNLSTTIDVNTTLFSAYGDQDGMIGCLDTQGRLWTVQPSGLVCLADPDGSPLIGLVAMAGNGKVAVAFKQAPNGRLCHTLCLENVDALQDWYKDPAGVTYDAEKQHFMMQGQPRQLVAGTGTFLLRMESGEVYSWGDARYSSLGRGIADAPAERPGVVEALDGLKIKKVACGGWLNAALSEDGACYIWGASTPGTERSIQCLREAGAGEVVLVDLPGENGGDPLDILDVAVGDNHVVILAEGNRCFGAGENKNGQLGLGADSNGRFERFVEDWTPIPITSSQVHSIVCGPKSTYAFTANST